MILTFCRVFGVLKKKIDEFVGRCVCPVLGLPFCLHRHKGVSRHGTPFAKKQDAVMIFTLTAISS